MDGEDGTRAVKLGQFASQVELKTEHQYTLMERSTGLAELHQLEMSGFRAAGSRKSLPQVEHLKKSLAQVTTSQSMVEHVPVNTQSRIGSGTTNQYRVSFRVCIVAARVFTGTAQQGSGGTGTSGATYQFSLGLVVGHAANNKPSVPHSNKSFWIKETSGLIQISEEFQGSFDVSPETKTKEIWLVLYAKRVRKDVKVGETKLNMFPGIIALRNSEAIRKEQTYTFDLGHNKKIALVTLTNYSIERLPMKSPNTQIPATSRIPECESVSNFENRQQSRSPSSKSHFNSVNTSSTLVQTYSREENLEYFYHQDPNSSKSNRSPVRFQTSMSPLEKIKIKQQVQKKIDRSPIQRSSKVSSPRNQPNLLKTSDFSQQQIHYRQPSPKPLPHPTIPEETIDRWELSSSLALPVPTLGQTQPSLHLPASLTTLPLFTGEGMRASSGSNERSPPQPVSDPNEDPKALRSPILQQHLQNKVKIEKLAPGISPNDENMYCYSDESPLKVLPPQPAIPDYSQLPFESIQQLHAGIPPVLAEITRNLGRKLENKEDSPNLQAVALKPLLLAKKTPKLAVDYLSSIILPGKISNRGQFIYGPRLDTLVKTLFDLSPIIQTPGAKPLFDKPFMHSLGTLLNRIPNPRHLDQFSLPSLNIPTLNSESPKPLQMSLLEPTIPGYPNFLQQHSHLLPASSAILEPFSYKSVDLGLPPKPPIPVKGILKSSSVLAKESSLTGSAKKARFSTQQERDIQGAGDVVNHSVSLHDLSDFSVDGEVLVQSAQAGGDLHTRGHLRQVSEPNIGTLVSTEFKLDNSPPDEEDEVQKQIRWFEEYRSKLGQLKSQSHVQLEVSSKTLEASQPNQEKSQQETKPQEFHESVPVFVSNKPDQHTDMLMKLFGGQAQQISPTLIESTVMEEHTDFKPTAIDSPGNEPIEFVEVERGKLSIVTPVNIDYFSQPNIAVSDEMGKGQAGLNQQKRKSISEDLHTTQLKQQLLEKSFILHEMREKFSQLNQELQEAKVGCG